MEAIRPCEMGARAESIVCICRGRAQAINSVGNELKARKQDHDEAQLVFDAQDWIKECLAAREQPLALARKVRQLAFAGKLRRLPEAGEAMLRVFAAGNRSHTNPKRQRGNRPHTNPKRQRGNRPHTNPKR